MDTAEFEMRTVMDAVISQGMTISREKGLQIIRETPREIITMRLFGDQVRLQQVLSDFLLNAVRFTPSSEGWVKIKVVPTRKRLGGNEHVMHLEFRYCCAPVLWCPCRFLVHINFDFCDVGYMLCSIFSHSYRN